MALTYTIMSVMTVTVWGPNLALRGTAPGDMERAVTGVKEARTSIYASFFAGIVLFIAMATTVAWIQMSEAIAVACTLCSMGTFGLVVDNGIRTRRTFRVADTLTPSALLGRQLSEQMDETTRSVLSGDRSHRSSAASSASTSSAAPRVGKGPAFAAEDDDSGLRTYEGSFSASRRPAWASDSSAGAAVAGANLPPQREPLLPRGSVGDDGRDSASFSRGSSFSLRRSSAAKAAPGAAAAVAPGPVGGLLGQTWPPPSPASPGNSVADSSTSSAAAAPAPAPAPAATVAAASHARAGSGQGLEHERTSQPDEVDLIASRLAASGGGWLQKRDTGNGSLLPSGLGGGGGWKRRWVSVHRGVCYYAKAPPAGSLANNLTSSLTSSFNSSLTSSLSSSSGGGNSSSGGEGKALPLSGLALSVGADGRTLRLSGPPAGGELGPTRAPTGNTGSSKNSSIRGGGGDGGDGSVVVDWRCESADDRAAWVAYFQAGIGAGW
jgi:hypothetical protein